MNESDKQLIDDIQKLLEDLPLPGPFKIFSRFFNERRLAERISKVFIKYTRAVVSEHNRHTEFVGVRTRSPSFPSQNDFIDLTPKITWK